MLRRHPLASLFAIILCGFLAGLITGAVSFKFYAAYTVEQFVQRGIGAPSEVGDGALWFLLIGSATGSALGLIVGLALYLRMTKNNAGDYRIT